MKNRGQFRSGRAARVSSSEKIIAQGRAERSSGSPTWLKQPTTSAGAHTLARDADTEKNLSSAWLEVAVATAQGVLIGNGIYLPAWRGAMGAHR